MDSVFLLAVSEVLPDGTTVARRMEAVSLPVVGTADAAKAWAKEALWPDLAKENPIAAHAEFRIDYVQLSALDKPFDGGAGPGGPGGDPR